MVKNTTVKFPKIFSRITGKAMLSSGTESINESLRLLILTSRGEMLGDPDFGTDILKCVYEHNDSIMNDILKNDIVNAISKYMSKVIKVTYNDIDITNEANKVKITIRYYINKEDSIGTYELVMLEGEKDV